MIPWDTFKTPQDAYDWAKTSKLVLVHKTVFRRTGQFNQWWFPELTLPLVKR